MDTLASMNDLPREVCTAVAAEILGVSKDTVLRLKRAGLLEYRDAAVPGSSRPLYRFTLASVTELRTSYTRDVPEAPKRRKQARRRVKRRKQSKYIRIHAD